MSSHITARELSEGLNRADRAHVVALLAIAEAIKGLGQEVRDAARRPR